MAEDFICRTVSTALMVQWECIARILSPVSENVETSYQILSLSENNTFLIPTEYFQIHFNAVCFVQHTNHFATVYE